jgi:hypothetical protein
VAFRFRGSLTALRPWTRSQNLTVECRLPEHVDGADARREVRAGRWVRAVRGSSAFPAVG